QTVASLIAAGREPSTPVAVIANATRRDQRTVVGTLETIAEDVARADLPAPALIVVGDVVARVPAVQLESIVSTG
ncbi:MAG: siroheme synthase CysG, partial [Polyangiales bacterium]